MSDAEARARTREEIRARLALKRSAVGAGDDPAAGAVKKEEETATPTSPRRSEVAAGSTSPRSARVEVTPTVTPVAAGTTRSPRSSEGPSTPGRTAAPSRTSERVPASPPPVRPSRAPPEPAAAEGRSPSPRRVPPAAEKSTAAAPPASPGAVRAEMTEEERLQVRQRLLERKKTRELSGSSESVADKKESEPEPQKPEPAKRTLLPRTSAGEIAKRAPATRTSTVEKRTAAAGAGRPSSGDLSPLPQPRSSSSDYDLFDAAVIEPPSSPRRSDSGAIKPVAMPRASTSSSLSRKTSAPIGETESLFASETDPFEASVRPQTSPRGSVAARPKSPSATTTTTTTTTATTGSALRRPSVAEPAPAKATVKRPSQTLEVGESMFAEATDVFGDTAAVVGNAVGAAYAAAAAVVPNPMMSAAPKPAPVVITCLRDMLPEMPPETPDRAPLLQYLRTSREVLSSAKAREYGRDVEAEYQRLHELLEEWARLEVPDRSEMQLQLAEMTLCWCEFRLVCDLSHLRQKCVATFPLIERAEAMLREIVAASYVAWGTRATTLLEGLKASKKKAVTADSIVLTRLAVVLQEQIKETKRLKKSLNDKEKILTESNNRTKV